MRTRLRLAALALATPALAALALAACAGGRRPGAPERIVPGGVRYVSRAAWGARDPVLPMRPHTPTRVTIHHTGVAQAPNRTAVEKVVALQTFSQRDDSLASGRRKPAWADIPYHLYVAVDGTVLEARDWRYVGDSNTPYDPSGHLLVVVEGNFERDTLSTAQRGEVAALVDALARRFRVRGDRLA